MAMSITRKIYLTRHAAKRLQGIGADLITKGYTLQSGARMLKMKIMTLEGMIMLSDMPSVTRYINLGRILGWDLSADANYYYAQRRRYTGKEIFASRIAKLCMCRNIPESVKGYYRTAYRNDSFNTESWYSFLQGLKLWEEKCGIEPLRLED